MKHSLPSGWKMTRLTNVGRVVTGTTPSKKRAEYFDGDVPFVTPSELDKFSPIVETPTALTELGGTKANLLPVGSVLVSCIGSLGKVGIAGVELATNQQINAVVPNAKTTDSRYLFQFCRTLKPVLEHIAPSTTLKIVKKSRFEALPIPLPPLPEQRRIAAILDKANTVRRKRQQTLDLADQFLRSAFLDMFGDPVTNPKRWPVKKLGDLADIRSGVTKGRKLGESNTISVPYMRVANVQDARLDLSNIKEIEIRPDELEKYRLHSGDILLTEGGDPDKLGRGAVWTGEVEPCVHQNHIFSVRITSMVAKPHYLSALIGSAYGKRHFLRIGKQTTGIATINKTQLREFPALLPPIELQEKYAALVARFVDSSLRFEGAQDAQEDLLEALTQSAFSGALPNAEEVAEPIPSRTALLDTSAFKALSRDALLAARENGWHLTTSPWCFFELLCHFDEEPDFAKAKGHLMKFRGIEIVDKPLDRSVAALQPANVPRIWSSDLVYAALGAIDAANSEDDLAMSVLVDEAGNNRGPLKDLADHVRRILDGEERTFQRHMTTLIAALKTAGGIARTSKANHAVIIERVIAEGLPLPDTQRLDYSIVDHDLGLKHSYCFWAYMLLQAIMLQQSGQHTCGTNDLEDGQLCGYIPLDQQLWVIAGDRQLRKRLTETRELLIAVALGDRACFEVALPDLLLQGGQP